MSREPWLRRLLGRIRRAHRYALSPVLVLLAGMAVGAVCSLVGGRVDNAVNTGRLVEFRNLNPAASPEFSDYSEMVGQYSRLTILTSTISPTNGLATVTVYESREAGSDLLVKRLDTPPNGGWARWEQGALFSRGRGSESSRFRVLVEGPPAGLGEPAERVDVLIYVSP